MTTIKVGIIGAGFAASSHLDALRRVTGVEVVAIAARDPRRAREEALRLGVPRGYGGYEELLRDETVNAVHNCTPNSLHLEVNAAALEAGKHVLSEKPLATNSSDSAFLVDLAQNAAAQGVLSGVCFNYRHYPLVRQIREALATLRYGSVHLIHGGYLQDWLLYESDWSWRLDPEVNGPSRAIADIGSHWLDVVQYVTGDRVVSVLADLTTLHAVRGRPARAAQTFGDGDGKGDPVNIGTEDFGMMLLRMASGARGSCTISQVSAGRKNRLFVEIDAAEATIAWEQEEPNRIWIGRRDRENSELVRDPRLLDPPAASLVHYPAGHQEGWPDALRNLFEDFYRAIAARRDDGAYTPSFATFAEAHRIVELVEAAVESHREQRWTTAASERSVPA